MTLGAGSAGWLAAAVGAQLLAFAALSAAQRRLLAGAGAPVPARAMTGLTYAANALSATLPGGSIVAAQYTMRRLRSWGASGAAAAFTVAASGVLSTTAFAALAVVWASSAGSGSVAVAALAAPIALAAVIVIARHRRVHRVTRRAARLGCRLAGRLLKRPPHTIWARVRRFVTEFRAIRIPGRVWFRAWGGAGLNWIADLVCLGACCHALGLHGASLAVVTSAFLAGKTAGSFSPLPAGLGLSDVAMVAALHGSGAATATSAVLCYRLISVVLVVAIGWLLFARAWLTQRRGRRPVVSPIRAKTQVPSVEATFTSDDRKGADHVVSRGVHTIDRFADRPAATKRRRDGRPPALESHRRRADLARRRP
jgi:uncharacterized protein (TIRG00374 family)